jgi:nicotinamidase/pyrazinamidase
MSTPPLFQAGAGLLLVDPQIDFCPGGALGVAGGDRVMPVLSAWAAAAERAGIPIYVSRDWHPPRTTHFKEFGGLWPPHCVIGTPGSAFHPDLTLPHEYTLVSKGMGATEDAYSAFQARDDRNVLLGDLLRERGVRHLYVLGLATDYCVRDTTLGGLEQGYRMTVVGDGVRAVNLQPQDGTAAVEAMRAAGAEITAPDETA